MGKINPWLDNGIPNDEVIAPMAWCAVWMPRIGDPPLGYLRRLPWFLREELPTFP